MSFSPGKYNGKYKTPRKSKSSNPLKTLYLFTSPLPSAPTSKPLFEHQTTKSNDEKITSFPYSNYIILYAAVQKNTALTN